MTKAEKKMFYTLFLISDIERSEIQCKVKPKTFVRDPSRYPPSLNRVFATTKCEHPKRSSCMYRARRNSSSATATSGESDASEHASEASASKISATKGWDEPYHSSRILRDLRNSASASAERRCLAANKPMWK